MKAKKSRGRQTGKRAIKDLPASDASAKSAKGGSLISSAFSNTVKSIGEAVTTAARQA